MASRLAGGKTCPSTAGLAGPPTHGDVFAPHGQPPTHWYEHVVPDGERDGETHGACGDGGTDHDSAGSSREYAGPCGLQRCAPRGSPSPWLGSRRCPRHQLRLRRRVRVRGHCRALPVRRGIAMSAGGCWSGTPNSAGAPWSSGLSTDVSMPSYPRSSTKGRVWMREPPLTPDSGCTWVSGTYTEKSEAVGTPGPDGLLALTWKQVSSASRVPCRCRKPWPAWRRSGRWPGRRGGSASLPVRDPSSP